MLSVNEHTQQTLPVKEDRRMPRMGLATVRRERHRHEFDDKRAA
jgi:hypothetical protein